MKRILYIGALIYFGLNSLYTQVQFANIHHVPLALTPASVGSKYGQRFSLAANTNNSEYYTNTNYAISFDTFSRRKRLALGAYYWEASYARNLSTAHTNSYKQRFAHQVFDTPMPNKVQTKEGGLCMGIKYNILDKNNPNTFKASITPALGMAMGVRSMNNYVAFGYASSNNGYLDQDDSLYYKHQITSAFYLTGQLGVKYNSERLLLIYHLKFRKEWVSEKHIDWRANPTATIYTYDTEKHEIEGQFANNIFENRITVAYIAYKPKNDKLGLTLYGNFGFLSPVTPKTAFTENSYLYSSQKMYQNRCLAGFSALAKVYKTLWGGSWSRYGTDNTYGLTAGLQSKYFKLLGTYFPQMTYNKPTTIEGVLMVYIPE